MTKGRSSSKSINRELQRSLPSYLGFGLRPGFGFLRSKLNPSDDRTRGVPLRGPSRSAADWFVRFKTGDLEALDSALAEYGLSIEQLRGLPDPAEIVQPRNLLGLPFLEPLSPASRLNKLQDLPGKPAASSEHAQQPLPPVPSSCHVLPRPTCAPRLRKSPHLLPAKPLSSAAKRFLRPLSESQFLLHSSFKSLSEALAWGRGWLDLFSGSRGLARALVDLGAVPWALCWDIRHSAAEDLLDLEVRSKIECVIEAQSFAGVSGGPVCASFSTGSALKDCRIPCWGSLSYPGATPEVGYGQLFLHLGG